MKIVLTPQESEQMFHDALCNGLDYMYGYGLELLYDERSYIKAKNAIKKERPDEVVCYEEVFMQILKLGGKLDLYDEESEEHNIISLEDVHERVALTPIGHLTDMIEGRDDADTADVIIQTVFLGEVIFG